MAARDRVVEKKATVAGEGSRWEANCDGRSIVAAGRLRASNVNGLVLAIMGGRWSLTDSVLLSSQS